MMFLMEGRERKKHERLETVPACTRQINKTKKKRKLNARKSFIRSSAIQQHGKVFIQKLMLGSRIKTLLAQNALHPQFLSFSSFWYLKQQNHNEK
jgi:hypothetical protein